MFRNVQSEIDPIVSCSDTQVSLNYSFQVFFPLRYLLFEIITVLTLLMTMPINGYAQMDLSLSVDSINEVGKELANYDFYPEKEHKKFISISCNKDELTVQETVSQHNMTAIITLYKMAFKDISLRFPLTIQSHNYKLLFKLFMIDESSLDTMLNTTTDFVFLNLIPGYQPKEIAEKQTRLGQILSRNILYLAYSKTLGKSPNGQLDSIYTVVRDNQKIRLDFAQLVGGVALSDLDDLPKLNQSTEIGAIINLLFKEKFSTRFVYPDNNLPLEIYFQITPTGEAVNIYTNQKVFWYFDFLEGQSNRFEIMNQGGNDYLFDPIKNHIGFSDLETLNAITNMIKELKFTPGLTKGKKVATIHKITIRP
ncbi:MAG: hypothetical protein IPH36_20450 [Saprospiraceae bacterium]|nr:hypothetical protein [Saprospiraceae bacterium]